MSEHEHDLHTTDGPEDIEDRKESLDDAGTADEPTSDESIDQAPVEPSNAVTPEDANVQRQPEPDEAQTPDAPGDRFVAGREDGPAEDDDRTEDDADDTSPFGFDGVAAAPGPPSNENQGKSVSEVDLPEDALDPGELPVGTVYMTPRGEAGVVGYPHRPFDRPLEHAEFAVMTNLSGEVRKETVNR